jgi:dienelactone hydrolase
MRSRLAILVVCGLLLGASAAARVVEEQFDLPVQVADSFGKTVSQPIKVTVFRDDAAPGPMPLIILNHGRPADAAGRAGFGRARYSDNARWFVEQGFVVAVPTRIGYGVSGDSDVEDSGGCADKRYAPGYAAAAQQTLAVLAAMRERTARVGQRAVVIGQSYGGMAAITVAALDPPGVVAAINFAGGGGGNPKTQPGQPCGTQRLERLYADYGGRARLPTLWVYTENDKYFGPTHPREWFDAFRSAGGNGEFIQFPPAGEDGHSLFTAFPATWRPSVAAFLAKHGFGGMKAAGQ